MRTVNATKTFDERINEVFKYRSFSTPSGEVYDAKNDITDQDRALYRLQRLKEDQAVRDAQKFYQMEEARIRKEIAKRRKEAVIQTIMSAKADFKGFVNTIANSLDKSKKVIYKYSLFALVAAAGIALADSLINLIFN